MAIVVVGLGNPGGEYAHTRHNAGRMAVEAFQRAYDFPEFTLKKTAQAYVSEGSLGKEKVVLVLPDVYMNHSGKVMPSFVKSVPAAKKCIIVRDELDMPLGAVKMTVPGRGSGGHKGVESVSRALKTKEFYQVKIGISGATSKGKLKKPQGEEKVVKHVIGKFSPKEEPELKKVLKKTREGIALFIEGDAEQALMHINTA